MAQKRQFEEQISGEGPNAVDDPEEQEMLKEMINELDQKNSDFEKQAQDLMAQEDKVRLHMTGRKKSGQALNDRIAACKEELMALGEALKVDPGIPVVKAGKMLFAKTHIIGPHKEIVIPQNMKSVRVAEIQAEGSAKHQMKISNLR